MSSKSRSQATGHDRAERVGQSRQGDRRLPEESNASYFVFPKGLDEFRDRRVVGLKYDLLAQPKAKGKPVRRTERKKSAAPKARPRADVTTRQAEQSAAAEPVSMPPPVKKEKAKPLHMFQVHARITGTVEKEMTIEAESGRAARQAVLKMIETAPVDFSAGTTRVRVTKVQRSTFKKS